MKTIILTLATAALIAIPILAPARNESGTQGAPSAPTDGRTGRPQPDGWMKFMADQLGLSAEQQEQVKAIYQKYAAQVKDLVSKGRENLTDEEKARVQAALRSQHEEVIALLDDTQKRKMGEMRQQMELEGRLRFMTDKLGLTADQQGKVKAICQKYAAQLGDLMAKRRDNLTDEEKARVQTALGSQHEEVVALLDDTQKRKMEELRQQWRPAGGKNAAGDRRAKGPRKADDAAPTDRPPNN